MDQSGPSADGRANRHEQFVAAHLDIDPTECRGCWFAGAYFLVTLASNRDPLSESVEIPPWARLSLGPHTSELTWIAILAAFDRTQLQRAPQPFSLSARFTDARSLHEAPASNSNSSLLRRFFGRPDPVRFFGMVGVFLGRFGPAEMFRQITEGP